jgi:RNA polymerase sigma-70 factor (ECF subfamily)
LSTLYAPLVFQWCRRRGLREPDAADVVQNVFQAVATHLEPFRKEVPGDTFRGWLRTITENKIRDHFRRTADEAEAVGGTEAQQRLAQLPAAADAEGSGSARDWDTLYLRRVLDVVRPEFEERTWQAFWRTAIDGAAPGDVAADLSMSAGAVRVAKCRVLKRLRDVLGEASN